MSDFVLFTYYKNIIKENKTLKLKFKFIVILVFNKIGYRDNLGFSVCLIVIKSKRQNYL